MGSVVQDGGLGGGEGWGMEEERWMVAMVGGIVEMTGGLFGRRTYDGIHVILA